MPKPSSIRSAVSVELRLVTDGETQGHGKYRGCIASRGKKLKCSEEKMTDMSKYLNASIKMQSVSISVYHAMTMRKLIGSICKRFDEYHQHNVSPKPSQSTQD